MRCTMINNKHLLHSLLIYRFNISCISQQCSRNLSSKNNIFEKSKVVAKKELLETECEDDIKDRHANAQYSKSETSTTSSQISTSSGIETESTKKFQSVINDEKDGRSGEKTFTVLKNTSMYTTPINTLMTGDTEIITPYPIVGFNDTINKPVERHVPFVSTILNQTLPPVAKARFDTWKEEMISVYGQKEFDRYRKEMRRTGKVLHSYMQRKLLRKHVTLTPEICLACHSVRSFLLDIKSIQRLGTVVTHPTLKYKCSIDCIGVYRNELCVIDWKKSDRPQPTLKATYDAPVELSAYIGAVNASNMLPFVVTKGLIVIVYMNGDPVHIYEVKDKLLQEKWTSWLKRLKKFYKD